ncbi:MAG: anthranilate synthase component II [Candidatus Phaeomarinobacter sp.]
MILVIDNYDSFVFNLARYVRELGDAVHVVRNDALTVEEALALAPAGIIISPGPCGPDESGISTQLAKKAIAHALPLLGVCLGHQCIVAACGGHVGRAGRPVHGQASAIPHHGSDVFSGLPSPLQVGRYHSLVATGDLPDELEITARLADDPDTIMGVAHRTAPVFGVQFHPESVLTEQGHALIGNFLKMTRTDLARSAE